MLLAIDDSPHSRAATMAIIEQMHPADMTVHVLHVIELDAMLPPAYDFARGSRYGPEVAAHIRQHHELADQLVDLTAQDLRNAGFTTATAVAEGDPRHTILDYAIELACECIVIGSHGRRRRLDRFFMGSVSESVVRHAHCSVYVVRPSADPPRKRQL
jgi:nucleotide-binding universal stress UspA family protein